VLVRNSRAEKKDFEKYLRAIDDAVGRLDAGGGQGRVPEAVRRRREQKKKQSERA
jgi:hypothetical protein